MFKLKNLTNTLRWPPSPSNTAELQRLRVLHQQRPQAAAARGPSSPSDSRRALPFRLWQSRCRIEVCRPSSRVPVPSGPVGLPQQDDPTPACPLLPPLPTGATGQTSTAQQQRQRLARRFWIRWNCATSLPSSSCLLRRRAAAIRTKRRQRPNW